MVFEDNPRFDYDKEPSRDILCIDCKSFYASVEAVARGLDPLQAKLVVMSYPGQTATERGSGLILASSPAAKRAYGISNVSRSRDLPFPYPADLIIAPPRMRLYMEKNRQVNNIYRRFVDEDNHHVYSIDESFIDVTGSLKLFKTASAFEMARLIQREVYRETGLYTTVGIGDNPLLAKLALDNESKRQANMKAEWRYEDVPAKLWQIGELTDFWGIGRRTAKKLQGMGVDNLYDLAHTSYHQLVNTFGVLGGQLYAHSWGIDRTFVGECYKTKERSIGNSQVLPRDYARAGEIALVIREMADQVGTRLRRAGFKAQAVGLGIGFSLGYVDETGKTGFHQQMQVTATSHSREIADYLLLMFERHYTGQVVRHVAVRCGQLVSSDGFQLNLFADPVQQAQALQVDYIVDKIRQKYGFKSIVHAASLREGGRAIARSSLVGGHAGGMAGIEGEADGKAYQERI